MKEINSKTCDFIIRYILAESEPIFNPSNRLFVSMGREINLTINNVFDSITINYGNYQC